MKYLTIFLTNCLVVALTVLAMKQEQKEQPIDESFSPVVVMEDSIATISQEEFSLIQKEDNLYMNGDSIWIGNALVCVFEGTCYDRNISIFFGNKSKPSIIRIFVGNKHRDYLLKIIKVKDYYHTR